MRKTLALIGFAGLLFFAALPGAAADYEGRLLDGHPLRAMIYGPLGAEPGIVYFDRDEARVQMLDGEQLVIVLYSRSFSDIHFVTGKTLDGHFCRLDLQESAWFYGRGNDAFFMPFSPANGPPVQVRHGNGRRGGG